MLDQNIKLLLLKYLPYECSTELAMEKAQLARAVCEGCGVRGSTAISEALGCLRVNLCSIMNYLGRESMVKNLETNFSKSLQMGFGHATRCLKGMQKVFGQRRGMGGKIINPIPEIIPIHVD